MDGLHLSRPQLDAALRHLLESPKDRGTLEMIVRRPAENEREVLDVARLDQVEGVVGDTVAVSRLDALGGRRGAS